MYLHDPVPEVRESYPSMKADAILSSFMVISMGYPALNDARIRPAGRSVVPIILAVTFSGLLAQAEEFHSFDSSSAYGEVLKG